MAPNSSEKALYSGLYAFIFCFMVKEHFKNVAYNGGWMMFYGVLAVWMVWKGIIASVVISPIFSKPYGFLVNTIFWPSFWVILGLSFLVYTTKLTQQGWTPRPAGRWGLPAPSRTVGRGRFPARPCPVKVIKTAGKLRGKIKARISKFYNSQ